jgi:DNA-binding IscR family transcriptional regulator
MPIESAEFDAHKNLSTIIIQYLCRNRDKGFSAKEIAEATGISESDVNNAMLKMGFSDIVNSITGKKNLIKIEDVTINGIIYYKCSSETQA